MESFSRGWSFLKQAWSMALQDKDALALRATGDGPFARRLSPVRIPSWIGRKSHH